MGNALNIYQGDTKKVLSVCSAGLLRSATLQNFLIKEKGYNVRNCGSEPAFALVPISEALLYWADEVVFVNKENFNAVKDRYYEIIRPGTKTLILDIPDNYGFNNPKLLEIIAGQYASVINVILQDIEGEQHNLTYNYTDIVL